MRRGATLSGFMFGIALAVPLSARAADVDYAGSDAGYLVYAAGTGPIAINFGMPYARTADGSGAPAKDWRGRIQPSLGGAIRLKIKNPDFTGEETGNVFIRKLPPGAYAITDFDFAGWSPSGGISWSSAKKFSIPFKIEPGHATYIGSFLRAASTPETRSRAGGFTYFVIADRAARDLPIAKGKLPAGIPVDRQVTNVADLGIAPLQADELR